MSNPKLALVPSAYRTSKVYSVLPVNGDGDFTFSRTGDGSRIKENGLIETVGSNNPRLNWSGECPSLLMEGTSTNLQIRSEQFDNSDWTKTNVTITANDTVSPDGTESADKLQRLSTSASYLSDILTIGFGLKTYTNSIFVKKGVGDFFAIRVQASYPARVDLRFQFSTKQIVSYAAQSGFTALNSSVEEFDNDWFRIYFTYSTNGNNVITNYFSPRFTQGDIDDTDVNNNANCFLWGAQIEEQLYGSSYIKTTTGFVTREKDICKEGGNATLFDITEGSFFVDVLPYNTGLVSTISLSNNSTSQRILIQFQSNGTQVRLFSSGGVDNYQTITFNQRNKILVTFKLNEYKFYINEALVGTDTSATVPTGLDRVNFSNSTANSDFFQGEVNDTRVYDKVLTQAEAIKLTT